MGNCATYCNGDGQNKLEFNDNPDGAAVIDVRQSRQSLNFQNKGYISKTNTKYVSETHFIVKSSSYNEVCVAAGPSLQDPCEEDHQNPVTLPSH
jgi:hypothetical protein